MQDRWFVIKKLISVFVFICALSFLGIGTGKPAMIGAYAVFFLVAMYLIFFFVKRHQRHFEVVNQTPGKLKKVIGIIISVIGIILPTLIIANVQVFDMSSLKVGFGMLVIVFVMTLVLIAVAVVGIRLINKPGAGKMNKVLGYLIVIAVSAVPALVVISFDQTTTGIGSIYYVALLTTIITWWGFNLYLSKD